jgi:hypothetical protein
MIIATPRGQPDAKLNVSGSIPSLWLGVLYQSSAARTQDLHRGVIPPMNRRAIFGRPRCGLLKADGRKQ